MGYFNSWRIHYHVGFIYGLFSRGQSDEQKRIDIQSLDIWGYDREWEQNLKGQNPNDPMSDHQIQEAAAWGAGARRAAGVEDLPYPQPPYPDGYTWSA